MPARLTRAHLCLPAGDGQQPKHVRPQAGVLLLGPAPLRVEEASRQALHAAHAPHAHGIAARSPRQSRHRAGIHVLQTTISGRRLARRQHAGCWLSLVASTGQHWQRLSKASCCLPCAMPTVAGDAAAGDAAAGDAVLLVTLLQAASANSCAAAPCRRRSGMVGSDGGGRKGGACAAIPRCPTPAPPCSLPLLNGRPGSMLWRLLRRKLLY
jgi:hypothetical protein